MAAQVFANPKNPAQSRAISSARNCVCPRAATLEIFLIRQIVQLAALEGVVFGLLSRRPLFDSIWCKCPSRRNDAKNFLRRAPPPFLASPIALEDWPSSPRLLLPSPLCRPGRRPPLLTPPGRQVRCDRSAPGLCSYPQACSLRTFVKTTAWPPQ